MKIASFIVCFVFSSFAKAHEGHDHAVGVGYVITTATETGAEGHRYVTVPGWGAMPEGKNIGALHGDLTLDKAGNVYVATIGGPGVVKFDRFGKFVRTLKNGLNGMHSLTTVEEKGKEFIWGSQTGKSRA
ncbi:MAG: hypothetical protein QNL80_05490, partial [Akkermansiaceae bacterium]